MDQFQKVVNGDVSSSIDLSRLNQFALRDADGTYQFITMPPRSIDQEYIDHVRGGHGSLSFWENHNEIYLHRAF